MKSFFTLLGAIVIAFTTSAQKQIFTYPFEFEKSFLQKSDYDAYFLDDSKSSDYAFVMKDNKKAAYVLTGKDFKIKSEIKIPVENTVFDLADNYVGGTADNGVFNFVYKVNETKSFAKDKIYYQSEKVDFNSKTISNKKVFEIPKSEKLVTAFSMYNRFVTITADDKLSELHLFVVESNGDPVIRTVPVAMPANANKKSLSEWISHVEVIKDADPPLESSTGQAKVFITKENLNLVVNNGDDPTHIIGIDLKSFTAKETIVDHSNLYEKSKQDIKMNSFLYDGHLYSIVVNKTNVTIAVYDATTGALVKTNVINEDSFYKIFVQPPVMEVKQGKTPSEEDVDDFATLMKRLKSGKKGIAVTQTKTGQILITAGAYDIINTGSGGGGGMTPTSSWVKTVNTNPTVPMPYTYHLETYYRPGYYHYGNNSGAYWKVYFRMLLDPSAFATTKGRIPVPTSTQIKEYISGTDKKLKATNQFSSGDQQYYGYYDSDMKEYVVEQINIRR